MPRKQRVFRMTDLTPIRYFFATCDDHEVRYIRPPLSDYKGRIDEVTDEYNQTQKQRAERYEKIQEKYNDIAKGLTTNEG